MRPTAHANTTTSLIQRHHPLPLGNRWAAGVLSLWLLCLFARDAAASPASTSPIPTAAHVCIACHGVEGAGNPSGIPRLAGMDADYLSHALIAFKSGKRGSDTMQPIARTLSDADINVLARYFAVQRPRLAPSPQAPSSGALAAGEAIARQGVGNGVPACFGCHAANGAGNGERYPRIAGEPAAYVVNRLHEFQARARQGAARPGSMTEVASRLTEAQIHDVAAYLSVTLTQ